MPESIFPRPVAAGSDASAAALKFDYKENPFSFTVSRAKTGEVLFDTSAASLVFESQYLRLRTKLPEDPNLYGLGEHSDPFRLNNTNYIRTLWSQDAYATPSEHYLAQTTSSSSLTLATQMAQICMAITPSTLSTGQLEHTECSSSTRTAWMSLSTTQQNLVNT